MSTTESSYTKPCTTASELREAIIASYHEILQQRSSIGATAEITPMMHQLRKAAFTVNGRCYA